MRWRIRFSLKTFLLFVAVAAVTIFVSLNGRRWHADYQDWRAARAIQARADRIFRDETGEEPPPELVHILGSGDLSHWAGVYDVGLTAEQIISCGYDRAVRCWSVETGNSLQVISDVWGSLAADSALLATIDDEQEVRVYDTSSSPLVFLRQFSIADESDTQRSFCSPFGSILAVIYEHKPDELCLFNLDDGSRVATLPLPHEANRAVFGFREDGSLLAVCRGEFLVVDAANGDVVMRWQPETWPFEREAVRYVVRLSPPWWLVVGASTEIVWSEATQQWTEFDVNLHGTPDLVVPGEHHDAWAADSGVMVRVRMRGGSPSIWIERTTPVERVRCMTVQRSGGVTRRAVGLRHGQVVLLDEYGRLCLPLGATDHVTAATWNGDGNLFAVGTADGQVIVMRAGSWTELRRFRAHLGAVEMLEFDPNDVALLSQDDRETAVFDWRSERAFVRLRRSRTRNATLALGGGRMLTWDSGDGWTLTDYSGTASLAGGTGKGTPTPQFRPYSTHRPAWSPAERCFVFVSDEGLCRLRLARGTAGPSLAVTKETDLELGRVQDFSTAASQALFFDRSTEGCYLRMWNWRANTETTIELGERLGRTPGMGPAAFLPSGQQVGVIHNGDLVIYGLDGEELYRQRLGPATLQASMIVFGPDGRYIATVNGNGTCYLLRNPCGG